MAEISSLLGLITDDQTRQALIAQMENMFDNAPDEERLIQEIGNPTKVAVALIRYADSGKITPAAAPVVAPAQAQPRRAPQPRPRAEQYRPMTAAAAQRPAPSFTFPDLPEEPDEPETDEAPVLDGQLSFDEQPADDDGYYDEQPADDDGYYDERPADDDGYYDEQPADDDGYYDEQPAEEYGEEYDEEYYDDYEPEYKTNVFLAILYTLGAIIIGVPVFAVLLVLDLAVLAIGAVCGAAGVSLIMTAFIGLPVVADMLILLGGGHIAQPLCRMAAMLDFDVTVVDDRPDFAAASRFPEAAHTVCDAFAAAIAALKLRESDYVCVITRGHRWDADCLRQIFSGAMPSYLGMIGSRRRVAGLMRLLRDEGYDAEKLAAIHAPIGLAIGAVTPAEIAVSICAQLVEHRRALPETEYPGTLLEQTNSDLSAIRYLAENAEPKALLLVLTSTGSTPVKSGALMAVNKLGTGCGTIGGGCSEAVAMQRARKIIGTGESCVIEIDMTNDVAADEGMVCGGTMRVLIEDASENKT